MKAGGTQAFSTLALLLIILCAASVASAQTQPIQYGYDEFGRLAVVSDPTGATAVYSYDAVGNLLSIQRIDVTQITSPVAITYFTPAQGKPGTPVSIFGKGFSATPSENTVSFSGPVATVTGATPYRLAVTVPAGAMTGPISVTTPLGSATSSASFRIIGPLTLTPAQASLSASSSFQFSVSGPGGSTPPVDWAVNGVVGGSAAIGTISSTGLYTAPAWLPQAIVVTITVSDHSDASTSASATATVVATGTTLFSAATAVSVAFPQTRVIFGSVGAAASAVVHAATAPTVNAAVTTWVGGTSASTAIGPPVTAALSPVITAVSPTTIARGASLQTIMLTGSGFVGTTAVAALLGQTPDTTVTVSVAGVTDDGTEATLLVTVASNAATGARVLQITTSDGTSTAVNTGANSLTVQ